MGELEKRLIQWMKTPRGQMQFIGITYAAAAVFAIFLAANRPFFERHIREKYAPVSAETIKKARGLGEASTSATLAVTDPVELRAIYEAWMLSEDNWTSCGRHQVWDAGKAFFLEQARKTLVGGSTEQKTRAVRLLLDTGDAAARRTAEQILARAHRMRDRELEEKLARVLAVVDK